MKRSELVPKLELVSGALANHDLVPVLTHFWFTGTEVMAFNEHTAISSPCKTDFVGAAPGAMLRSLVGSIQADDIELSAEREELFIRGGKGTKAKIGLFPIEKFLFTMPKPDKKAGKLPISTKAFLEAMTLCMRSIGVNTATPETQGVTIIPKKKTLLFGATDSNTMTVTEVDLPKDCDLPDRVLLPIGFCQTLLSMAKGLEDMHLEINDDFCLHVAENGDRLWGRIAPVDNPVDYIGLIGTHVPKDIDKILVPRPAKLLEIIDRAIIITGEGVDEGSTTIGVEDGVLVVDSQSVRGEATDKIRLKQPHDDITVKVKIKHLRNGVEAYDKMRITKRCVIMKQEASVFLVSV